MSEGKKRGIHMTEFKAKVVPEAMRGGGDDRGRTGIQRTSGVGGPWKKGGFWRMPERCSIPNAAKPVDESSPEDHLYGSMARPHGS